MTAHPARLLLSFLFALALVASGCSSDDAGSSGGEAGAGAGTGGEATTGDGSGGEGTATRVPGDQPADHLDDTTGGETTGGETTGGETTGGETTDPVDDNPPVAPTGLAILGNGTHDLSAMELVEYGTAADGLDLPRDIEFNPSVPGEAWVANRNSESMVVYSGVGTAEMTSQEFWSFGSAHFFAQPSAIAFGAPGTFATIHETDQPTQGEATPVDFMGPTLQDATLNGFDAGHGSHLDMLHNSPLGMGIAWEQGNVYWVFDGYHSSITRYDFNRDHGRGGADHSDGIVLRFAEDEVARVADVPSHMEMDRENWLLYIADTGNNRIAVLDATAGEVASAIGPNYDGTQQFNMTGWRIWTHVEGADHGMELPSGLVLHEGHVLVSDHGTSTIYAFNTDGELVDWLDTGLPAGCLMGIAVDHEGILHLVDAANDRVMALVPRAE